MSGKSRNWKLFNSENNFYYPLNNTDNSIESNNNQLDRTLERSNDTHPHTKESDQKEYSSNQNSNNSYDTSDETFPLTTLEDINNIDNIISGKHRNILDIENTSQPPGKSRKRISFLYFIMVLLTCLAFIFMGIVTSSLVKGTPIKKLFSHNHDVLPKAIDYSKQGIIQPANLSHMLPYNAEARRSSKKLYELLTDFDTAYYDDENMILGTTLFTKNVYSRQTYVANGYLGSRLPNIGFGYALDTLNFWSDEPGALNNGWPLRNRRYAGSFISDFYSLEPKLNSTNFPELDDKGYSTVIASIPEWTDLQFKITDPNSNNVSWFNPVDVKVNDVFNYNQNLSMKDGIVTTQLDWYGKMIHVKSEVWAHRRIHPLGVMSLDISLNREYLPDGFDHFEVEVLDILDFNTSERTVLRDFASDEKNGGIYMVVEPNNVPYSNASVYSTYSVKVANESVQQRESTFERGNEKISHNTKLILSKDSPHITVQKYVGIMSSEFKTNEIYDELSTLDVAKSIVLENKDKYRELLTSHKTSWYSLYSDAFIEIPSDALLEMTARSSLYQLLANTRHYNVSERGLPVGVGGLSSDSYAGMVFWDADIWMAPALLPFFPQVSKNMNNYRNSTHREAQLNAQEAGYPGAVYPWTSGRYANCTSTGPCIDYEYHINVDVALATFSIYMNGAEGIDDEYLRYTTWPIVRDAAQFFTAYVKFNETLGQYETYNLTDPDEFANHINNGAFTNAGIKTLLKWATDIGNHLREDVDDKWMDISHNIHIPRSTSNITLEYTGMNNSVEIKQADVTLMVYPLGYINDESILYNAIKDLYYYSERQSASGPAMTYPVFAAAAAGLLNHGSSSQSYLYKSVLPYLRQPFAQFSEQSDDNFLTNGLTQPAFPFLTANGGFLQSILFGLTGIRYSYEVVPETKKISRVLKFNPVQLPLMPGGLAIRNFKYMDQVLDIIIDDVNGTIVHKSGDKPIKILVPNRGLIHDRDINIYERPDDNKILHRRSEIQVEKNEDRNISGKYYILQPNEEFVLPLFRPGLNIENNIAESQQITNLTAGVPGDVAFSAIDGNNYTHWQPLNKEVEGKLLIDLGIGNAQKISKGAILWGQRPAKNVSISILPHSELVEQVISNVTNILENSDATRAKKTIKDLLGNISRVETDNKECVTDILSILNWKGSQVDDIIKQMPDIGLFHEKFVTVVDNLEVTPSEPYFGELINNSVIELLPSNKTEFIIDYSTVDFNDTMKCFGSSVASSEISKARYIVLSVEGTFDDDKDPKGATIKEIAFSI